MSSTIKEQAIHEAAHADLMSRTDGVSCASRERLTAWLETPETEKRRVLARGLRRIANNLSGTNLYRPLSSEPPETPEQAWACEEWRGMVQRDAALLQVVASYIAEVPAGDADDVVEDELLASS